VTVHIPREQPKAEASFFVKMAVEFVATEQIRSPPVGAD